MSFELLGDEAGHALLAGWEPRFSLAHDDPRTAAHALCSMTLDPALARPAHPRLGNALRFVREPDGRVRIEGGGIDAVIERTAPRRYAVSAKIAPDTDGALALMRGASAAIVHAEGGLVLHAAAVELDGHAVLYVGPSGAGKSTAVALTDGGRCFAYDHVAVVPGGEGMTAWGLPGGTAVSAPHADDVVFPLAAVLRVRRRAGGGSAPQLARATGTDALFVVRESVEWAEASSGGEELYLQSAARVSDAAFVGNITTVLDTTHAHVLRAALPALQGTVR